LNPYIELTLSTFFAVEFAHNDTRIHELGRYIKNKIEMPIHDVLSVEKLSDCSYKFFTWQTARNVDTQNKYYSSPLPWIKLRSAEFTASGLFLVANGLTVGLGISEKGGLDFLNLTSKDIWLKLLLGADVIASYISYHAIAQRRMSYKPLKKNQEEVGIITKVRRKK